MGHDGSGDQIGWGLSLHSQLSGRCGAYLTGEPGKGAAHLTGGGKYVLVRLTGASFLSDQEHLLCLHCIKLLHLNCVALTSPDGELGSCCPLSVCVAASVNTEVHYWSVRVFAGKLARSRLGAV